MMIRSSILCALVSAVLAMGTVASGQTPTPTTGELPLSNADVVKLWKLGLGDEVVIAKINQARAVEFKLDTDSLVELKGQGISKDVIAAMLNRSGGRGNPGAAPAGGFPSSGVSRDQPRAATASQVDLDIRLGTSGGEIPLRASAGDFNEVGFAFVKMLYFEIPGTQARLRTNDGSLVVAVAADFPPKGYISLVRIEADHDDNNRSLKVGSAKQIATGGFRSRSFGKPDKDFVIDCDFEQRDSKTWLLKPKAPLGSGEYGVWAALPGDGGGGLYDFGVD